VLIFAGPSIAGIKNLNENYRDFFFLPPLRHADLISSVEYFKPHIVGIIDDYSGQFESVWQNEIMHVLEKGVEVFGAAGIGAIRAVELEKYGMKGIGKVYEFYKKQLLSSDEEVISFFDKKNNYKRITEPLINIRFTIDALRKEIEIPDSVFDIIKSIFWKNRTRDKIISELKLHKIDEILIESIFEKYYDIQREDSLLLLTYIKNFCVSFNEKNDFKDVDIVDGNLFGVLYERDRKVKYNGGEVSLNSIANYALINHAQSEDIVFNALNREIVAFLAEYLNVEINENDIELEKERLCAKLNIENVKEWMQQNDINKKDFFDMIKKNALCRKMQSWFIARRKYRRTTSIINEQLILQGEYLEYKKKTVEFEKDLSENELKETFNKFSLEEITALKIKRDGFPWNVPPFKGASESGISKLDFKLYLSKEEIQYKRIKERLNKFLLYTK